MRNPLRAAPYYMMGPAILLQLTVVVVPLLIAFTASFRRWYLPRPQDRVFVGFENYLKLLTSPEVLDSVLVTLKFIALSAAGTTLIGLAIGLLLSQKIRGTAVFRSLLIVPMMITPAVNALLWITMWHGSYGVVNNILAFAGLPMVDWVSNPRTALLAVVIPDIWQWTPFVVLVVVGGMQSLPLDVFEAATVDGASGWRLFTRITLPLLMPFLSTAVLFKIVYSLRVYDLPMLITKGGPGRTTEILSLQISFTAFNAFQIGKAAAHSFLILFFLIILGTLLFKFFIRMRDLGYTYKRPEENETR
jgi:multiple sugar transport system permease protein